MDDTLPQLISPQSKDADMLHVVQLHQLTQTIGTISLEAKDERELLQLAMHAIGAFTKWSLGYVFLRHQVDEPVYMCSDISYVRYFDVYGHNHERARLHAYKPSHHLVQQMQQELQPIITTEHETFASIDLKDAVRVLIPMVSRRELFGFFEWIAYEEPEAHLLQVLHTIGHQIGMALDVKQTARDLRRFKQAVDESSDYITISDPDAYIVYVNKAVQEATGYTSKELQGRHMSLWTAEEHHETFRSVWESVSLHKKPFQGDMHNKRKDGSEYTSSLQLTPVLDDAQHIDCLVGIERDITKEREVDRLRSELISVVSHQLRTPLTSLSWLSELLHNKTQTMTRDQINEYTRDIRMVTQNMIVLIKELMDMSRLEVAQLPFVPEEIDLQTLLRDLVDEARPLAEERNIRLSLIPIKEVSLMWGDAALLGQVLHNLISNGIRYVRDDTGQVTVLLEKKHETFRFVVADNGIGIEPEAMDRLFEKFYRSDHARMYHAHGSGLGLYIVKSILDTFGGSISVQSELDKGTTFIVEFPHSGMQSPKQDPQS